MMHRFAMPFVLVVTMLVSASRSRAEWQPAKGPLMTRWAKDVAADHVHAEYPRPQLVRKSWQNLNGLWDYAIRPKDEERPAQFDGQILVPFAVESALSGVMKTVGEQNRLWYRRNFDAPDLAGGKRLLLHFGAVDWHTIVWMNGKKVGEHKGGYDPFQFDITDVLADAGPQQIVLSVWDPTDRSYQPRGKQVSNPGGIWYTSVTGVWQTVWLEAVPKSRIGGLRMTPDIDRSEILVTVDAMGAPEGTRASVTVTSVSKGDEIPAIKQAHALPEPGHEVAIKLDPLYLWTPDEPWLYELRVELLDADGKTLDAVDSYFAMRKISLGKDRAGINRLLLNNKPLFMFGPLDQGWWPDGLYTAPTDEALRYDIEVTRQLGFNMARKHVKIEPARWYYHCDKLGLMVWQDMPSGDRHIGGNSPDLDRSPESAETYRRELKALIDNLRNHPSIVVWVPFNEGWGQFDTNNILGWVKQYDPTRLVDGPSGWTDRGTGDIHDIHRYPGPGMPDVDPNRAVVLGEFGGLGLPLEGHLWWNKRNWGYRTYKTRDELRQNYLGLMKNLQPLIGRGLAAAIYTQTTDVEGEVNGLMTYDRAVTKMDVEQLASVHRKFYLPPVLTKITPIVPTSETDAQTWRYTTGRAGDGWQQPDFDDSSWEEGQGGFGTNGTPGAHVRTTWNGADIWLRRKFDLKDADAAGAQLRVHHDEDAVIFINGVQAASLPGFETGYVLVEIDKAARQSLRAGSNTIAVHCHQTGGGQYIDVGLVDVIEIPDQ